MPASVAVLTWAKRTPVGTAGRSLANFTTTDLAAPLLSAAAAGHHIDDVLLGNCLGAGGNVARVATLAAGLDVPAVTVDRQCGSGLDAVLQGAARIRSGDARTVLAGGVESASTAPERRRPDGERYTRAPFAPPGLPDPDMGPAADDLARRRQISRDRQDEWALRSHTRCWESLQRNVFDAEIVPVHGVTTDDRPRPMTADRLHRLPPAFGPDGTATAGNSCGISDGAAVLRIEADAPAGLEILATAVSSGDPAVPGACLAPAMALALEKAQVRTAQIGAVELTEAFASVALAAIDELDLDPDLVCSDGGAIGLGHPWGASGALLLVRLFSRMMRPGGPEVGLAGCAIGGGQGIAAVVRRR